MAVDARHVGYTVSPHEECAVELAIQTAKATGGEATVLSLGSEDAVEQLRDALAVGCTAAVLVEAEADRWGPADGAAALAHRGPAAQAQGGPHGLGLLGQHATGPGGL